MSHITIICYVCLMTIQARRNIGGWGTFGICSNHILAATLTLFQPGGQIIPTIYTVGMFHQYLNRSAGSGLQNPRENCIVFVLQGLPCFIYLDLIVYDETSVFSIGMTNWNVNTTMYILLFILFYKSLI